MAREKRISPNVFLVSHVAIILLAYVSPFLFDWRIVVVGAIIYSVVGTFWGFCPLTVWQFGRRDVGFYEYYLGKIGIHLNKFQAMFVPRYVIPGTIAAVAILMHKVSIHPLLGSN